MASALKKKEEEEKLAQKKKLEGKLLFQEYESEREKVRANALALSQGLSALLMGASTPNQ
ncbi:hypothetical protein [Paraburkholderia hospita]|nr:hypothetical protein [Paraburkholderia hospita]